MYANYHTHTFRCHHAEGTEEEYIENAIANGIKILGFSEHAPFAFPDGSEAWYRITMDDAPGHIAVLKALREKYKDKIQIHIGFEMEYYPLYFKQMLEQVKEMGAEYLILGQHFLENGHGTYAQTKGNSEKQLIAYTDGVIEGMATGKFLYVAHPDIFLYTEDDSIYNREATRLCAAAKEMGIPLEINLLGLGGGRHYPNPKFMEVMGRLGCKVVIGMDAHLPSFDMQSYTVALEYVKKYNLNLVKQLDVTGL